MFNNAPPAACGFTSRHGHSREYQANPAANGAARAEIALGALDGLI
jgi:hypothetical protein